VLLGSNEVQKCLHQPLPAYLMTLSPWPRILSRGFSIFLKPRSPASSVSWVACAHLSTAAQPPPPLLCLEYPSPLLHGALRTVLFSPDRLPLVVFLAIRPFTLLPLVYLLSLHPPASSSLFSLAPAGLLLPPFRVSLYFAYCVSRLGETSGSLFPPPGPNKLFFHVFLH